MRKLLPLLMVLLLLCGCTQAPEETTAATKVGVCWFWAEDAAGAELRALIQKNLEQKGYEVTVRDAGNDQSLQNTQVAELIAEGVELLIVEPVMPSASESLLQTVKTGQTPVVFVNRKPDMSLLEGWNQACYVGFDPARAGTLQGQLLETLPAGGDLNGDGEVAYLIIQGPEDHLQAQACTDACAEALNPNAENLAVVSGDWTEDSGRRLCANALSKYGRDVEVILCGNGPMTMGALSAVTENGWVAGEDLYLVGMGGDGAVLEAVEQGLLTGTVYANLESSAARVAEVAQLLLAGQTVDSTELPYAKVTNENIAAFLQN